MKKRITHITSNENIIIPDIVNEKCSEAYGIIRADAPPVKKFSKKKFFIISAVAAATLAFSATATAAYFRSAFDVSHKEVYTKDPEKKMDLSAFAKPVNDEEKQSGANITMQSVYCDGQNLAIGLALTPNDEDLKRMTTVSAHISAKLNGKSIDRVYDYENLDYPELGFVKSDDGVFYETMYYTNLDITEESELEISIYGLQGINGKLMTYNYAASVYEPERTSISAYADDKFEFKATVTPDTSNNRTYEINETKDGITLESVDITPFKTTVSIDGLAERQSIRIFDQNGEELEIIHNDSYENWEWKFVPPLKTAKRLSVQVFDIDTDDFPTLYEFTFDIEKGFADKYDVKFDNSDVVYVPPYEELNDDEENLKKYNANLAKAAQKAERIPVNTPVERTQYIDEVLEECGEAEPIAMEWKITGSRIGDVAGNVSEDHWEVLKDIDDVTPDNAKMLFVTYEITNKTDLTGSIYTNGGLVIYSKDFEVTLTEPDYASNKDYGGKSSWKYTFEPGQTKTITYGYVIPEDYANEDFYAVLPNDLFTSDATPGNIANGVVKLMEIK